MDLDLLRTYIAVVDTGSLTRAARQVHRTQAALSMQMKRLEEQSGRRLFCKEGRLLELTADGKALVGYARRLLALHDEALARLNEGAASPPLRLGCPDDYAQSLLPELAALLRERHPDLELQLVCAPTVQLRTRLDDGHLDLAILTRAVDSDEGHLLRHDRGIWIQHPDFDWHTPDPLSLVLYEADCKFHSAALDGLDKQHRPYRIRAQSANAGALMALVRRGDALTAGATASRPDDLIEVPPERGLTALPGIDIALVGAARAHPRLNAAAVGELAGAWHRRHPTAPVHHPAMV